jgi:hypothetical protein
MSMSDCESSLSVFETPNCNFSANPFNMPQALHRGVGGTSKKLLSKRIFLDLDNNHFAPTFSSPRSKIAKKSSTSTFINEQTSLEFRTSLIRLLNGESLQRLKDERRAAAAAAAVSENDDTSVDTIDVSNTTTKEENEDEELSLSSSDPDQQAILSAALLFSASSPSPSPGSRRASVSSKAKELATGTHDNVVLGRRIQRRHSGIARCA